MSNRVIKLRLVLLPMLAVILLSGCVVSESKYDALNERFAQYRQQAEAQRAADAQRINALNQQVTRLQGAIKYTVNSDLLFAPGSWQISEPGKQVMAKLASQLAANQQAKLIVNGYTDNAPVGRSLMKDGITSNDILSQKRAESVMQFLIGQGVKPELISAKGWGENNPVAPNDTPQGRAQNRRVEITIAAPGT